MGGKFKETDWHELGTQVGGECLTLQRNRPQGLSSRRAATILGIPNGRSLGVVLPFVPQSSLSLLLRASSKERNRRSNIGIQECTLGINSRTEGVERMG